MTLITLKNGAIAGGIVLASAAASSWVSMYDRKKNEDGWWYDCIKPAMAPPNWVFSVVWTILYVVLAYLLARAFDGHLPAYTCYLLLAIILLNVVWCLLFFGAKKLCASIAIIGTILAVALAMLACMCTDDAACKWDCLLFSLFVAWIAFATLLNAVACSNANEPGAQQCIDSRLRHAE